MTKVGIIGCGNISGIYLQAKAKFSILDIVACADLIPERAQTAADEYSLTSMTVDEMLDDPDIEIIINLTVPAAHADVTTAILNHGKHAYSEKPMALNTTDGKAILDLAQEKGLRVGGAPDTFLGAGIQTCRKLIDDGWIGDPIAAVAFMTNHGHESWHPDPEFYYQLGGGPMLDMGPYYLTAMIALMGPVVRVTGSARVTFAQRTITSAKKYGNIIDVEVPTHVLGVLDFTNGAIGSVLTTFDVWSANLPFIEIYGSQGTLSVPDPNTFGGPVSVRRYTSSAWSDIPLTHLYHENSRGLGVADMATAIRSGRDHRANGKLTYHVLDIMESIHTASEENRHITITSTCERPAPFPLGMMPGILDE